MGVSRYIPPLELVGPSSCSSLRITGVPDLVSFLLEESLNSEDSAIAFSRRDFDAIRLSDSARFVACFSVIVLGSLSLRAEVTFAFLFL